MMEFFDFTPAQGAKPARPSAARIVAAWKRAGKPAHFRVTYGETEAEFQRGGFNGWDDSGNGCRGVDRLAVVKALKEEDERAKQK